MEEEEGSRRSSMPEFVILCHTEGEDPGTDLFLIGKDDHGYDRAEAECTAEILNGTMAHNYKKGLPEKRVTYRAIPIGDCTSEAIKNIAARRKKI